MKILLPVDGSEYPLAAVRHAIRLVGEGLGASLVLANVRSVPVTLVKLAALPVA